MCVILFVEVGVSIITALQVSCKNFHLTLISRLEKGYYSPNMEQLFELSNRYGVSMSEITNSVEQTYANALHNGKAVETEKNRM